MKKIVIFMVIVLTSQLLFSTNFDEANKLYEQENYEEAIDALLPLIKKDKNNLSYNRLIAQSYLKLSQNPETGMMKAVGFIKKAKKYFEKVAKVDQNDIESRENLAFSYFFPPKIAGGNKKKARTYLAEIKQLSPQKGMEIEIEFLLYEKEYDQVENICQAYIVKYPEDSDVYYSLGMMYQEQKKYNKAFETFETHVQKDPEAWNSMYQIGRTAVFSGTNLEKGIEFLTQYSKHKPGQDSPALDSVYWRLGMLYELQGNTDQAISAYESGLKINPDNSECKKSIKKLK
ncbi:MAG: tetratricopeptide repeat protein [Candidatus Tenebribacter burtonii]|nr:tetratricopeptide repeat protein [Candidatus Tenebribacter burtonii]